MENNDIVQEYAEQQQTTTQSSSSTDILQEYANSLKEKEESEEENHSNEFSQDDVLNDISTDVSHETFEHYDEASNIEMSDEERDDFINTYFFNGHEAGNISDDVLDEEDFIRQRTGGRYNSWEELEDVLNTDNSQVGKFENETTAAIYNMLAEGKINEVVDLLQKKTFADSLKDKSDDAVLKAYIKANNPEFDSQDIEDEYNEKYVLDEFAFDDTKLRREQKKLNQRIKLDVENAKEFFSKSAEDIKFPQYTQPQSQQAEEFDDAESQEERSKFLSSLSNVEKRVNNLPFSWRDDKTNLSVNGKFEIPSQELSKYREGAENLEAYLASKYYQDGQYKGDELVKHLYVADNLDKIISSAVSQAVNQTRLEILKKSKNISIDNEATPTFRPNASDEESNMFDKLFMGHLTRRT